MYHDAAGPTGAREATAPRGLMVGRCLSTRSSRGTGDAVISLRPPYHCRRHRPGAKLFVRKHQTARGSVRIYRQGSPRAPADSPAVRAVWPVPWSPSAECRHRVRDDLEHARWQRCKRRGERCEVTGLGICARASRRRAPQAAACRRDGHAANGALRRGLARVPWGVRLRACVRLHMLRPIRALASLANAPSGRCVSTATHSSPRVFADSHDSLRA